MAEMEEGGRDKTPVQSQQPSATTPSGADEKSSGKERRDAGEKDKEQELSEEGPVSSPTPIFPVLLHSSHLSSHPSKELQDTSCSCR